MEHQAIPLPPPAAVLSDLPASMIADTIERLIDELDARSQPFDPDVPMFPKGEGFVDLGDETPGCDQSDPGGGDVVDERHDADDEGGPELAAWPERIDQSRFPKTPDGWHAASVHEDAEEDDEDCCQAADDDPARIIRDGLPGDQFDVELNGDEGDYSCGDCGLVPSYGVDQTGARMPPGAAEDTLATVEPTWSTRRRESEPYPDDLPDLYASICRGTCLEPVFMDGVCLAFSKVEPPVPGDYVGMWFVPEGAPPGEIHRWVKKLVSAGPPGISFPFAKISLSTCEPAVIVEMLNPPKRFWLRASRVLAMHKVMGVAEPGPNGMAQFTMPAEQRS